MVSALVYLLAVLVVAAVVYVLASLLFGRGEELQALPPGATPTRLPTSDVEASDVRSLRFQQVVRGYKASEVDWVLERLARELEDLRGQVATMQRQVELATQGHDAPGESTPEEGDREGRTPEGGPSEDWAPGGTASENRAVTENRAVPENEVRQNRAPENEAPDE